MLISFYMFEALPSSLVIRLMIPFEEAELLQFCLQLFLSVYLYVYPHVYNHVYMARKNLTVMHVKYMLLCKTTVKIIVMFYHIYVHYSRMHR